MMNIILFGPPGSGKGTQAGLLKEHFNLIHISTGDLFRYEIGNNTPLGTEAKSYMDKGQLVPDSITINMLINKMDQHPETEGFIFDGFPRTVAQADALDTELTSRGNPINILLSLAVDEDELVNRLLERGKTSGRSDDANETVIRNRQRVYKENTQVVYDHYDCQGKAVSVNGIGSIEEIADRLGVAITQYAL